jgi:putative ABC transport system permease protein
MISPRLKKLWRDLRTARSRMIMMVVAIAVSIFGVGTILSAYTILTREISRNYMGTNPATAFLELDRIDDSVIQFVRRQPEVKEVEATSWITARFEKKPNEWMPLLLFVVPDFKTMTLDTVSPEKGEWPPSDRTILLERAALPLTQVNMGDSLTVQTPNGSKQSIRISGLVHDPGLAPAWQEQTVYGYINPATMEWLGEGTSLHILKVQIQDQTDPAGIDATIAALVASIKQQGYAVDEIRIPPQMMHPHQSQMNSILIMLLIFSLMALVLSAILMATMVNGLLAQQIRQIGIMKAIGARSIQIAGLYLLLILLIGLASVGIGIVPGVFLGRAFAGVVGQLLNFNIVSNEIPAWVFVVQVILGTLIPLAMALGPIWQTSRLTVQETLNDYGTNRRNFGSRKLDGWLGRLRGVDNTLLLSIRNTFRRRSRLILTLGLLASAGAMFITGLNTKLGWETYLANSAADRKYDLEIRFNQPQPMDKVYSMVSTIPGVERVESWSVIPAALPRTDGLDIVRTYPDGGHGSLSLRAAPSGSNLIAMPMIRGKWLVSTDTNAVVLNQMAAASFPGAQPGDSIQVMLNGKITDLQLVGVVKQILTPATAYVLPETFSGATGMENQSTNAIRVVTNRHTSSDISEVTGKIESALATEKMSMKILISETMLEGATSGHILIFIYALILIAVVMAVVGALGLTSSMSTSVIERTRELGIMRAVGARSRTILKNIIGEGVFIGLLSWILAVPLSLPLTWIVGNLIGTMSFRAALPLTVSYPAIGFWFILIILGSIGASAYPAQQASKLTVRETLAYV